MRGPLRGHYASTRPSRRATRSRTSSTSLTMSQRLSACLTFACSPNRRLNERQTLAGLTLFCSCRDGAAAKKRDPSLFLVAEVEDVCVLRAIHVLFPLLPDVRPRAAVDVR